VGGEGWQEKVYNRDEWKKFLRTAWINEWTKKVKPIVIFYWIQICCIFFYQARFLNDAQLNPDGGEIFRTRPDRSWGSPSLLYNGHQVFPGVKRPGRDADHPPPSSAEVKKG
jgi:hypothetical protein